MAQQSTCSRIGKKKAGAGAAQDPKSAALAHLGVSIGSKNMRNLKKEEIDTAFIQKLHDSEHSPELFVHPPKVPSKRAFQRSLHESYQYMMKMLVDQAHAEAAKIRKRNAAQLAAQQAAAAEAAALAASEAATAAGTSTASDSEKSLSSDEQ